MNDLEQKRKNIEKFAKIAGALAIGFVAAPFIWVAIGGLLGLVAGGIVGITLINFTPWFAAKLANWKLQSLKHEASKNPIETLQNNYRDRQIALNKFAEAITTFTAEVSTFADKLVGFSKTYPDEAEKFKGQLLKMRQLLDLRNNKYRDAKKNLKEYELEIQKASAIWDMGQAAAAMNKAAGMSEDDFFAKIQVETALDSVQKNLNMAFAELETSLLDEDEPTKTKNMVNNDVVENYESKQSTRTKIAV